jgi:hypothetical protein
MGFEWLILRQREVFSLFSPMETRLPDIYYTHVWKKTAPPVGKNSELEDKY